MRDSDTRSALKSNLALVVLAVTIIVSAIALWGFTPSECSTGGGCGGSVLTVRADTVTVAPELVTYDLDGDGQPEVEIEGTSIRLRIDGCERTYIAAAGTWVVECGGGVMSAYAVQCDVCESPVLWHDAIGLRVAVHEENAGLERKSRESIDYEHVCRDCADVGLSTLLTALGHDQWPPETEEKAGPRPVPSPEPEAEQTQQEPDPAPTEASPDEEVAVSSDDVLRWLRSYGRFATSRVVADAMGCDGKTAAARLLHLTRKRDSEVVKRPAPATSACRIEYAHVSALSERARAGMGGGLLEAARR